MFVHSVGWVGRYSQAGVLWGNITHCLLLYAQDKAWWSRGARGLSGVSATWEPPSNLLLHRLHDAPLSTESPSRCFPRAETASSRYVSSSLMCHFDRSSFFCNVSRFDTKRVLCRGTFALLAGRQPLTKLHYYGRYTRGAAPRSTITQGAY